MKCLFLTLMLTALPNVYAYTPDAMSDAGDLNAPIEQIENYKDLPHTVIVRVLKGHWYGVAHYYFSETKIFANGDLSGIKYFPLSLNQEATFTPKAQETTLAKRVVYQEPAIYRARITGTSFVRGSSDVSGTFQIQYFDKRYIYRQHDRLDDGRFVYLFFSWY